MFPLRQSVTGQNGRQVAEIMAHEMRTLDWSAEAQRLGAAGTSTPAILVGGMHRSGTSALTRALALAGADLPRTLMAPGSDNPLGFWESIPIAEVNDAVLAETGSRWDDVFGFSTRPEAAPLRQASIARIRQAVASEFETASLPIIKDPRISLILPMWDIALREAGHTPHAIALVRHPMEVAQSLAARNGYSTAKSLLLWIAYLVAFERDSRNMPRVFVSYDDLLTDWRGTLDRIERKLGLLLPRRSPANDLAIEQFLTNEARHHRAGPLRHDPEALGSSWVSKIHDWAQRAASADIEPDPAELEAIRHEMTRAARTFAPVVLDITVQLDRSKAELAQLPVVRDELARTAAELEAANIRHEETLAEERGTAGAAIASLEETLADERRRALAEFQRLESERDGERTVAKAEFARLENEISTASASNAQLARQLAEERTTARATITTLEDARARLSARLENEVGTARRELAGERERARLQTHKAARLEGEVARLNTRLEQEVGAARKELTDERERTRSQTQKAARLEGEVATLNTQLEQEASRVRQEVVATREAKSFGLRMQAERDEETHRADGYADQISALQAFVRSRRPAPARILRALWKNSWTRPVSDSFAMLALTAKHGPRHAAQLLHMTRVIRQSGALDADYYLNRYWDVDVLGRDPVLHYVVTGASEMRDPAPDFSTKAYLERYPDVARDRTPALFHFVRHGRSEGRLPVKSGYTPPVAPPLDPPVATTRTNAAIPAPTSPVPDQTDVYAVRPDDVVRAEAQAGEAFLSGHRLLGDAPDYASAVAEINRAFAERPVPSATPDASIVIPIYGQLAYTLNALHALARHVSKYSFEIIVVDDCSPDASARWLAEIPAIRLHRQSVNGGFIESCNTGARLANGHYLVMLNNDTRVVSGWLDGLLDSFATLGDDQSPVGLVGSKLFYPDGSLQEAGGILWRDGSAWNYGRNDDPGKPEYCYARQVDYVSGCSLAIRADLWREIGGFDAHYKPAYGEDSDMALKVRYRVGRGVWMQPLSRVIHYEGKTSGTDTSGGVKAYQIANARKLYERWASDLSTHRPNAEAPHLERDRGISKRALVLDATTPEPDKDAGSLTCFELMRALQANGYKVSFLAESNLLYLPEASGALQRAGIEVGYAPYTSSVTSWLEANGADIDVVLIFRNGVAARQMADVRKHCPNATVIFHSSDLHFLRLQREAELAGDAKLLRVAGETRRSELGIIRGADATIVHSTFEERLLLEVAPGANIATFPWILDPKGCKTPFDQRRDIAFLGGYRHPPNADAVRHFVEAIWPRIHAANPQMRFIIAGSEMPPDLAALDGKNNIVAMGYVADLDALFEKIRLTVAPIRYGAGIKGKVAMSFAYGVPSVLTSCAAEGMELRDGDIALIHDDPAAFADAVLALYDDPARWAAMSADALTFVEKTYGSHLGRRRVADIIAGAKRSK